MGKPASHLFPEGLALKYDNYMHMYQNRINAVAMLMGALFVAIVLMVYLVSSMKSSVESKNIIKKILLVEEKVAVSTYLLMVHMLR